MEDARGIAELLPDFFRRYDGTVESIGITARANHQHARPPGDGMLTCVTVDVALRNHGLFGTTGPFLDEVFPRYRFLTTELARFLADRGVSPGSEGGLSVAVVPRPERHGYVGNALPKIDRPSRGVLAPQIDELARYSEYYRALAARYGIEYGLITNNGTVIGPDGGIVATAAAVADAFDRPLAVVELGAGAGSTATALLRLGKLRSYRGRDFSPEVASFFASRIQPDLAAAGVPAELVVGPCESFALRPREADLLVVGVYYEAQPDLVLRRGEAIRAALSTGGVLAIQSGKPESPFVTQLLADADTPHKGWPWYRPGFCVCALFRHLELLVVEDETMLLASNDADRLAQVSRRLAAAGRAAEAPIAARA
jgi:hypothetical protein